MTPNEVQGLQALAMKHGGSLTINPDTGLPEANFLKKLLPMIAGFALGPAGMGIAFGGLSSAASAGLLVGGVTGLATGSLSKGLMAGLGAYGGAGLGAGLETAAVQGELASSMPTLAGQAPEQIKAYSDQVIAARDAAMSKVGSMGGIDKLSAGFDAVKTAPGAFLKDNMMPLAAAAAPIAADMMVPTATKAPTNTNPAYIRQKIFDPYTQQMTSLEPVKASEWGSRNFSDVYKGANGGIVALAGGGLPIGMADGTPPKMLTDEQLYQNTGSWDAAAAARDAQNNAMNQYTWDQQGQQQQKAVNQWVQDNPLATKDQIGAAIKKSGMNQMDVNRSLDALTNSGQISNAANWAIQQGEGLAGLANNTVKWLKENPNATQSEIDAAIKKHQYWR
jgi:hypothetical protein